MQPGRVRFTNSPSCTMHFRLDQRSHLIRQGFAILEPIPNHPSGWQLVRGGDFARQAKTIFGAGMRVVLTRLAIERSLYLLLQVGILLKAQFIKILQCASHRDRVFDLFDSQVMELDTFADDVGQSLLESEWSVLECCDTISKHLLQSSSAVANATKYKVVDAQEVKGDIPQGGLVSEDHRIRKVHHVTIDSDRYVATGCVAMREVPVFVGQYRAKPVLLEIVEYTDSKDHDSLRFIL